MVRDANEQASVKQPIPVFSGYGQATKPFVSLRQARANHAFFNYSIVLLGRNSRP